MAHQGDSQVLGLLRVSRRHDRSANPNFAPDKLYRRHSPGGGLTEGRGEDTTVHVDCMAGDPAEFSHGGHHAVDQIDGHRARSIGPEGGLKGPQAIDKARQEGRRLLLAHTFFIAAGQPVRDVILRPESVRAYKAI